MNASLKMKSNWRESLSQLVYTILNILFALGVLLSIVVFSSPVMAVVLVVLSKWRVFAVKPRFWWANIQSNTVDFVVGLSYVVFINQIGVSNTLSQALTFVAYIAWLIFVKPKSSQNMVIAQGLISLFVGLSAVFIVSYEWSAIVVFLLESVICFVSVKHFLSTFTAKTANYYVYLLTLFNLELLWVLNNWVISYFTPLPNVFLIQPALVLGLANLAICLMIVGLIRKNSQSKDTTGNRYKVPIVLCLVTIAILLLFLSMPPRGGSL